MDKRLEELSREEWESLCDGCGKCCLIKLEDTESGLLAYTNVACRYLDLDTCRCRAYPRRAALVSDCLVLTPETLARAAHLPSTCAYRLRAEGKALPAWHPLVSGRRESVARAGQSITGRAVSEDAVQDLEHHLVDWLE